MRLVCHTLVQISLIGAYLYSGDQVILGLMVGVIGGAGIQALPTSSKA